MTVKLSEGEHQLLATTVRMPDSLRELVRSARKSGHAWELDLSEDHADELRDLCGDTLVATGFDEHYEPTREGLILEGLIDKFFTG